MKKYLLLFITSAYLQADIHDYLYKNTEPSFSSYGSSGLIQTPNARFLNQGSIGIVFSSFEPYQRISFLAYPFSWMEASYQYTDISTRLYSDVFAFSGNQTYKDKGFDLKFKLLNESYNLPQLAIGLRDIGGTGLFSSEYIVLNKSINNFDVSLGFGTGKMSNNDLNNPLGYLDDRFKTRNFSGSETGGEFATESLFRGDLDFFGGIEYYFKRIKGLRFKLEKDSTNYVTEAFAPVKTDSEYNYGFTWSARENFKLSLGYIRGNTLQLGFSFVGDFGKKRKLSRSEDYIKMNKIRSDAYKRVNSRAKNNLYITSFNAMNRASLPLRSAHISDKTLEIAFAQNKYLNIAKAFGRAVRSIDDIAPDEIENLSFIMKNTDYEMLRVRINRKHFNNHDIDNDFVSLNETILVDQTFNETDDHEFIPDSKFPAIFYTLGPSVQSHIGGPDRFFVGGLKLAGDTEILFNRNFNFLGSFQYSLYDSFNVLQQPSDSILPRVRTDVVEYLKGSQKGALYRSQFNYFYNPSKGIYAKLSAGIFEEMFAGYGFEILRKKFDSNFAIGLEAYRVRQRGYRQLFSFKEYETTTGHATFYYFHPYSQILTKFIGGKYLAQDSGFTFEMSRRFKSGLVVGAFFSQTDISKEEFGEGSFDKGFFINFPFEILSSSHSRRLVHFGLKPVTRDGAAKLLVGHDLWGITESGSSYSFYRDIDSIYD